MKKLNLYSILIPALLFGVLQLNAQSLLEGSLNTSKPSLLKPYKLERTPRLNWDIVVGLGFPAGRNFIGTNLDYSVIPDKHEAVSTSYGSGGFLGAGAGLSLCDHFDFGLEAMFFYGCNTTIIDKYNTNQQSNHKTNVTGLYLRPSVTAVGDPIHCNSHDDGGALPYARLGANLPLYTMMNSLYTSTNNNNNYETRRVITQRFEPGVFAGVGANWKLNDTWGISAELQAQVQAFTPLHALTTSYKENGADKMNTLTTTYSKETDYVDSYKSGAPDYNKPSLSLAEAYSQSSFNICVRLTHNYSHRSNTPKEENNVASTPPPAPAPAPAPADKKPKACNCSVMNVRNIFSATGARTLNMVRDYNKGTNTYSFKFIMTPEVEMTCSAASAEKTCEGVFITEITVGGGTTGYKKVLSAPCGSTNTFSITVASFFGSSATSEGLNKVNSDVKMTYITICDGQMKRISRTLEIMNGDLVNSKWGKWEVVNPEEAKQIEKSYEKSSTEYLKK